MLEPKLIPKPMPLLAVSLRSYFPWIQGTDNDKLNTADFSLAVGLNIILTLLISIRLLRAHRRITKSTGHVHNLYLGVIAVLVESATPIAVFGIAMVVTLPLRRTDWGVWKAVTVFHILFNIAAVRFSSSPLMLSTF